MPSRQQLLNWLSECTGETIWSVVDARDRGIPDHWIETMADAFESNPTHDRDTIYVGDRVVGQYHGIRDVDLARRIAAEIGLPITEIESRSLSRSHLVRNIHDAIEEG